MLTISSEKEQEKKRKEMRIIIEKSLVTNHSPDLLIFHYTDENQINAANYKDGTLLLPKEVRKRQQRLLPLNRPSLTVFILKQPRNKLN
jgi:hypothetical protein